MGGEQQEMQTSEVRYSGRLVGNGTINRGRGAKFGAEKRQDQHPTLKHSGLVSKAVDSLISNTCMQYAASLKSTTEVKNSVICPTGRLESFINRVHSNNLRIYTSKLRYTKDPMSGAQFLLHYIMMKADLRLQQGAMNETVN